jgi:preprotein translocase subunit YajC
MATLVVANQAELETAIRNVKGGDTILLQAGTYADLNMTHSSTRNYKFTETVTIKSADPNNRAVVNELFLLGIKNVVISDIDFDYNGTQAPNTASWQLGQPFYVENAGGLVLDQLSIDGHRVNGYGTGTGLRIKGSTDVTVSNVEMNDFKIAMNVATSSNVTIKDNSITEMSQDGLYLGALNDVLIENNYIGDFNSATPTSPTNKDGIQFYTNSTTAASDGVTIRGNTFESESLRQNITILNEAYKAGDLTTYHRDILIEDNYIRSANTQGVTVAHSDGVIIRNNTVAYDSNQIVTQIPLINVSTTSLNVNVSDNTIYGVDDAPENATTITVGTQAELLAALTSVRGGDTILLEAGTYEDLNLTHSSARNYKFTETVTIKSEDVNNRAVVNELFIFGVQNLVISDIDFDYTGAQASSTLAWQVGMPFYVESATDLMLDRLDFDGHRINGFSAATGLRVKNSSDVTISNTEMTDFKIAMNISGGSDFTIRDNDIKQMSQDGLYMGGLKNVTIEDNYFGDYLSADPSDPTNKESIQFYTNGSTAPSEGVTIRP